MIVADFDKSPYKNNESGSSPRHIERTLGGTGVGISVGRTTGLSDGVGNSSGSSGDEHAVMMSSKAIIKMNNL